MTESGRFEKCSAGQSRIQYQRDGALTCGTDGEPAAGRRVRRKLGSPPRAPFVKAPTTYAMPHRRPIPGRDLRHPLGDMRSMAKPEKEEAEPEREGGTDGPLLDLSDDAVKNMIKAAKKRGY